MRNRRFTSILILPDAGPGVGLGHLTRCVALAQAFRRRGARIRFVCADPAGARWLRGLGFAVASRFTDGPWDLAVLDTYRLAEPVFRKVRAASRRVLVIDDLGRAPRGTDWILNSSPAADASWYASSGAKLLLGPRFHPLREEFLKPASRRPARFSAASVLVTLGGGQPCARFECVLDVVREAVPSAHVRTVRGGASAAAMRRLMLGCDLAVSGTGQTAYELAACGLPAVLIRLADNQRNNERGMVRGGAAVSAGAFGSTGFPRRLRRLVRHLADDGSLRRRMGARGRALVDGRGATRVAERVLD